jgi:hypothetical protein
MELDPLYCDVIVQRWESFTGKKAQREPAVAPVEVTEAVARSTRPRPYTHPDAGVVKDAAGQQTVVRRKNVGKPTFRDLGWVRAPRICPSPLYAVGRQRPATVRIRRAAVLFVLVNKS